VAVVALAGPDGGEASVPAQVVAADPESVEIGDPVETTMRRIYTQEGVTRYGFKIRLQGTR
jgi:hydroxymethylglutaryl-CoA synthase